jgi:hypothetical protein
MGIPGGSVGWILYVERQSLNWIASIMSFQQPIASDFNGADAAEQFAAYRRDPASVEESWGQFFRFAEQAMGGCAPAPASSAAAGGGAAHRPVKGIHARIPNNQLLMHGSSSVPQEWLKVMDEFGGQMGETYGVPVEEIVDGFKHGVREVNIDTDLWMSSTGAIRQFLGKNPKEFDPRTYLAVARSVMKALCKARYEQRELDAVVK